MKLEEEVIIWNILDMDSRGFVFWLVGIEDMVNFILESRGGRCISKLWAYWFV